MGSIHFEFKGCWVEIYNVFQILKYILKANSAEPDQKPHSAVSDLVLHCLLTSHKMNPRLIWVKAFGMSKSSFYSTVNVLKFRTL